MYPLFLLLIHIEDDDSDQTLKGTKTALKNKIEAAFEKLEN